MKAVKNYRTDLLCAPWYFGDADTHQANHAGTQMVIKSTGFEVVQSCFQAKGGMFEELAAMENEMGMVGE